MTGLSFLLLVLGLWLIGSTMIVFLALASNKHNRRHDQRPKSGR